MALRRRLLVVEDLRAGERSAALWPVLRESAAEVVLLYGTCELRVRRAGGSPDPRWWPGFLGMSVPALLPGRVRKK